MPSGAFSCGTPVSSGRVIREPVVAHPWLAAASSAARSTVEVVDFGTALHWRELDEDMGVNQLLGVSEEEVARLAGFTIYSSRP
jgi:hypothetical protein